MKYNVIFADGYDHHDFEMTEAGDMVLDSVAKIMMSGAEIGLVYELDEDINPDAFEHACETCNAVKQYGVCAD
jgi:hypothetical protein